MAEKNRLIRLSDSNSTYVCPVTKSDGVFMSDGNTTLETKMNEVTSQLEQKANKNEIGTPLIASSVSEMLDKTKVYVNTTDKNWYSWNGEVWVAGGVYNSQGIGDGEITPKKTNFIDSEIIEPNNLFNKETVKVGTFNTGTGVITESSSGNRVFSDFIKNKENLYLIRKENENIYVTGTSNVVWLEFDNNKNYLGYISAKNPYIKTNPLCEYVICGFSSIWWNDVNSSFSISKTNDVSNWNEYFEPYEGNLQLSKDVKISEDSLPKIDNSFGLKDINMVYLFSNIVCIGDSLTRGYYAEYESGQRNRDFNYPTVLKKILNTNVTNLGYSGSTPTTWFNKYKDYDFSNFDCAIICLGTNGGLESSEDNTNYKNIITKLIEKNPNIKIFCLSLPPTVYSNTTRNGINERIQLLANELTQPYIDISKYDFIDKSFHSDGTHFYTVGYLSMAQIILKSIDDYIHNNINLYMSMYVPKTTND